MDKCLVLLLSFVKGTYVFSATGSEGCKKEYLGSIINLYTGTYNVLAQYRSDGLVGDDNTTPLRFKPMRTVLVTPQVVRYLGQIFLTSIAVKTNLPQIAQISKS